MKPSPKWTDVLSKESEGLQVHGTLCPGQVLRGLSQVRTADWAASDSVRRAFLSATHTRATDCPDCRSAVSQHGHCHRQNCLVLHDPLAIEEAVLWSAQPLTPAPLTVPTITVAVPTVQVCSPPVDAAGQNKARAQNTGPGATLLRAGAERRLVP